VLCYRLLLTCVTVNAITRFVRGFNCGIVKKTNVSAYMFGRSYASVIYKQQIHNLMKHLLLIYFCSEYIKYFTRTEIIFRKIIANVFNNLELFVNIYDAFVTKSFSDERCIYSSRARFTLVHRAIFLRTHKCILLHDRAR